MDPTQDPSAQGVQPGAVPGNAEGQPTNESAGKSPGFQARIDELTKARRDAERQNAMLQAQVEQLNQQMVAVMSRSHEPPAPKVEVDPEEQLRIQAVIGPQFAAMQAQVAEAQNAMLASQVEAAARSVGVNDAEMIQKAQNIAIALKRAGTPLIPMDAVKFVYGGVALDEAAKRRTQQTQLSEFNGGGGSFMSSPGAPNVAPRGETPYPANFESMSPASQAEWIEKNRLGDKAF